RLRGDGADGGDEAGRRNPPGEAGCPVPRPALRDARRRVADARPVPARRVDAAQRRADADPQGAHGPLPVARLLHRRLVAELEKKGKQALVPSEWDYAPAPESREIVRIDERYGHFVGGEWLEARETYTTISPASEEPLAEGGQGTPGEVYGRAA